MHAVHLCARPARPAACTPNGARSVGNGKLPAVRAAGHLTSGAAGPGHQPGQHMRGRCLGRPEQAAVHPAA